MSEAKQILKVNADNREATFNAAYNGSYYTILGCAGDLNEWTAGYKDLLETRGIGTPKEFITFKGADMNEFYGLTGDNAYNDELTCLMFPLNALVWRSWQFSNCKQVIDGLTTLWITISVVKRQ